MKAARLLSFFGMFFLVAGCCPDPVRLYPPESSLEKEYIQFSNQSWWEFEGPEGQRKRFRMLNFDIEMISEIDECRRCGWPHCRIEEEAFSRRTRFHAVHNDNPELYLTYDIWQGYGLSSSVYTNGGGGAFTDGTFTYLYNLALEGKQTNGMQNLLDTNLTFTVKGTSVSRVRSYIIPYSYFEGRRRDTLQAFLAPEIGPVKFILPGNREWNLTDYNVFKP